MSKFVEELKRRNVIKAAIAYAVVAWVALQVLALILPNVGSPEWVMKTLTIITIIGFPIWIFISWVYEVTPEGLKKTEEVSEDKSITTVTNKRLNILILVGLVLAIVVSFFNKSPSSTSNSKALVSLENSIAVLPFDDMSSGGDTEWFCDGVTEDILTNLSKLKELKVISRTSTERYKNTDKSIPEIAAELGVSYIVEGSVRKHNDKVIITAQLIDANDTHIWAQNYNDNFDEVFKIQADVSKKIVDQLRLVLSPEESKEMKTRPTDNLEAYELVLKGRNFKDKVIGDSNKIAAELFEQAIELDPNYAQAYAELAYTQALSIYQNPRKLRDSLINEATKNADKAIALNPNTSLAYSTKGLIVTELIDQKDIVNSEIDKAETYFMKALELNPNDSRTHIELSFYYGFKEEDNKRYLHGRKAYELDPLSVESNLVYLNSLLNVEKVKIDEAKTHLAEIKNILPNQLYNAQIAQLAEAEAKVVLKKNGTVNDAIEVFKKAILEHPKNAELHNLTGRFYDSYLNDDANYAKHMKKAFELETSDEEWIRHSRVFAYHNALIENKQFEEALTFQNTKDYKILTKLNQLRGLWAVYYHQNKNSEALEVLKDSLFNERYQEHILVYAQMGEKDKVYQLLSDNEVINFYKVAAFAHLKERDSLYKYLNIEEDNFVMINSRREFNPYRKDPRYIDFLKKHNLPLIEAYNGKAEKAYNQ